MHDETFNYRLLSRLQQDCEFYLGYGMRCTSRLWAGSEEEQIAKMREIYAMLPEKPQWITPEDIDRYAAAMLPAPTQPTPVAVK